MPSQRRTPPRSGSVPAFIERKVHVIVQFDEEYNNCTQYTCTRCQTRFIILDEPKELVLESMRPCPHCFKVSMRDGEGS